MRRTVAERRGERWKERNRWREKRKKEEVYFRRREVRVAKGRPLRPLVRICLPLPALLATRSPPRRPNFFSLAQRVARFRHGARCFSCSWPTIFLCQRLRGHALPLQWPRDRNFSRGRHPFPCYPAIFFHLAPNRPLPSFVLFPSLANPPPQIFLIFTPVFFPPRQLLPPLRSLSVSRIPSLSFSLSLSTPSLPFSLSRSMHGRERRRQRRRRPTEASNNSSFPSLAAVRSAGVCFKRSLEQARGYDADCLCALYLARVMCTYVFDRVFIRTPQESIAPSPLPLWLMSRAQCYWCFRSIYEEAGRDRRERRNGGTIAYSRWIINPRETNRSPSSESCASSNRERNTRRSKRSKKVNFNGRWIWNWLELLFLFQIGRFRIWRVVWSSHTWWMVICEIDKRDHVIK